MKERGGSADILNSSEPDSDDTQSGKENDDICTHISNIMSTGVITVGEDDPTEEIIEKFKRYHYHTYPVVDPKGKVVGLIDQDIIMEILLFDRIPSPAHTHFMAVRSLGENARAIMKPNPVTISPDTDICDTADIMIKHHINHVFVVDDGKLLGIVSKKDIIKEVSAERGLV